MTILIVLVTLVLGATYAQFDSNASGQAAQPAATESPGDIISFLNQTIVWSRQLIAEQQLVNELAWNTTSGRFSL